MGLSDVRLTPIIPLILFLGSFVTETLLIKLSGLILYLNAKSCSANGLLRKTTKVFRSFLDSFLAILSIAAFPELTARFIFDEIGSEISI